MSLHQRSHEEGGKGRVMIVTMKFDCFMAHYESILVHSGKPRSFNFNAMKHGYNKFWSQICYLIEQINPVIRYPGYDEEKWPGPSSSLWPSLTVVHYNNYYKFVLYFVKLYIFTIDDWKHSNLK